MALVAAALIGATVIFLAFFIEEIPFVDGPSFPLAAWLGLLSHPYGRCSLHLLSPQPAAYPCFYERFQDLSLKVFVATIVFWLPLNSMIEKSRGPSQARFLVMAAVVGAVLGLAWKASMLAPMLRSFPDLFANPALRQIILVPQAWAALNSAVFGAAVGLVMAFIFWLATMRKRKRPSRLAA